MLPCVVEGTFKKWYKGCHRGRKLIGLLNVEQPVTKVLCH